LASIMREEIQRGRVSQTRAGGYALITEAFEADTIEALRSFA
jgi:hypothetical protein